MFCRLGVWRRSKRKAEEEVVEENAGSASSSSSASATVDAGKTAAQLRFEEAQRKRMKEIAKKQVCVRPAAICVHFLLCRCVLFGGGSRALGARSRNFIFTNEDGLSFF